jgi:predicted enzyme related to lactoylglutathione lyase
MIKRIAFTFYPVKEMARARHFYEQELGLKVTEAYGEKWIEYDLPGGCFALSSMVAELRPSDHSGAIAFEVDDVNTLTAHLKNKGYRIILEPTQTPVCRMSVVSDPEGNSVILHQVAV